jgi:hypothetical protein
VTKDIKIGDRVMVRVPSPYDPELEGKQLLRKPGGLRGKRMETIAEIGAGLCLGRPVEIPRTSLVGYFTGTPEEAEVTPWLLQMLHKRSLVMVDSAANVTALADEEK